MGELVKMCSAAAQEMLREARPFQTLRQLAHDLHANEPLDQGRRSGQDVRGATSRTIYLLMDRAYEGNKTRLLDLKLTPVVSPKKSRIEAWEYDRGMHKGRGEVGRLFRRLKGFRRVFS
jgi:hypothetical protein